MMRNLLTTILLTLSVLATSALAQTPSILSGEIAAIDQAGKRITLKTKDGEIAVAFDDKTEFKRVTPENPDLKAATAASQWDISAGDKIVAVVVFSDDKKTIKQTRRVILMTKSDIAKKQELDSARWTTRGVAGRVTAVNPTTNEITVAVRGMGGERTTIIATSDKTAFRRYAPNSVKYNEAKTSNFGELTVGDQLRAVGEKSADGNRLTAEEVLSGSFRMLVGKIETINAGNREVTVKDAQTNKSMTISLNDNTLLRRFPTEVAQRMAQMQAMRQGGMAPSANAGGQQPGQMPNGGQPGPGGGQIRGGARGDLDSLLEQMPALILSELKVGDAIAALSSASATPDRMMAIKFVAGVEPFLNAPQIPSGAAGQGGGRAQSSPSISIPGLDGVGAP